jgi:C4-dicarboxylate transporter, DctQ subunit
MTHLFLAAPPVGMDWTFVSIVGAIGVSLVVLGALVKSAPWLDKLEEIIIASLIAMATLLIFVAVVQRYSMTAAINLANMGKANGMEWLSDAGRFVFKFIRGLNLTWAQELCIYMFVWMAKFGAAFGVRQGIHVGVDVLINRYSGAARSRVVLFGLGCGALFTFIVGSLGARFVWHIAHTDQTSADLELPMWLVYLAVPLGSYLMCFRFIQVAAAFIRTGELPVHDHGHVDGLDEEPTAIVSDAHIKTGAKS